MSSLRDWTGNAGMRAALAGVTLALLLCAWTVRKAIHVEEVAAAPATVSIVAGALDTPPPGAAVNVGVAIDADLFSPTRKAPVARYRMPGEPAVKVVEEPPKPIVLGVALAADGSSFATCQFQSAKLLMVRVGDKIGEYTVRVIERGRVVFSTPAGKTFEVLAPRAGS